MKPMQFPEKNKVYTAPPDMKECQDLHTYEAKDPEGRNYIISAWEITPEEILNLLLFKRLWVTVFTPVQMPIYITPTSPFLDPERTVTITETERAAMFKKRVVRQYITEYFEDGEVGDSYPAVESVLMDFIDFLTERGE